jgi:hypothetical protein
MKKLILIILFFVIGCGSSPKHENTVPVDSIQFYIDTIPAEESAPVYFDKDLIAEVSESTIVDTTKKVKKTLTTTKLDTVSVLPEIRRNMEVMKYQQKQLDSLIKQAPRKR